MEESFDKLLIDSLIDTYSNLLRIKFSEDREKEIEYQLKTIKERLKIFQISTDQLEME